MKIYSHNEVKEMLGRFGKLLHPFELDKMWDVLNRCCAEAYVKGQQSVEKQPPVISPTPHNSDKGECDPHQCDKCKWSCLEGCGKKDCRNFEPC